MILTAGRGKKISAAAVVAVGIVGLASSPAYAGESALAVSGVEIVHAEAYFKHETETVEVCDRRGEGKRAVARLKYGSTKRFTQTLGGLDTCKKNNYSIAEGTNVTLTVCVRDGAHGKFEHCATAHGEA
ncbi:hypothetical protein K378_00536 [Streptomyces sp. Amel2xB2]|uniref:hypothetical protein n=1 Tax=Streptomyces sp. Amel2xB2 TaxID=1305829 RepID=UPI000DBFFEB5|nr:hypothetical protein [Streptomyces sp. Amel2xB2]RAJ71716.1 hypothetical protein K378_00536 [Streptomyces sp. Amel2xB2]